MTKKKVHPYFMGILLALLLVQAPSHADENGDVEELQRQSQDQSAVYAALNESNPFSSDLKKSGQNRDSGLPGFSKNQNNQPQSAQMAQIAMIRRFLENPIIQWFLKVLATPAFINGMDRLSRNPNRTFLLYSEGAWILLFVIYRAWRQSKLDESQWLRRMIFRFSSTILYFAVATLFLPWAFLGNPYSNLLQGVYRSLIYTYYHHH